MTRDTEPLQAALAGLDIGAVRRDVLAWYRDQGRRLPWRETRSVFGVWVSEIMLQQTTVATVIPRWREFMARYPDVQALAGASEAEVLDAWRGLGYYRRARQLHRAARVVVDDLGGRFPGDVAGWRALPGVGDYTAGAVASIGLGQPAAAVDTNVDRVLRRLVSDAPDFAAALKPAAVRDLAAALADPAAPGDWTQALMDLGAGPCAIAAPVCTDCPLATCCRAHAAGVTADVPPRVARPQPVPVLLSLLVAHDGDGLAVCPPGSEPVLRPEGCGVEARQSYGGLYRGYWRLPSSVWFRTSGGRAAPDPSPRLQRAWAAWLGVPPAQVKAVGAFRGAVTRYRQQVLVFRAQQAGSWPEAKNSVRSGAADPERPLAQPDRRALELAVSHRGIPD